jgi:hypothetical protein
MSTTPSLFPDAEKEIFFDIEIIRLSHEVEGGSSNIAKLGLAQRTPATCGLGLMRSSRRIGFAMLFLLVALGAHAADKVAWKPVTDAVLRIDDRAPKQWSLYHSGKKFDPLLLQLGSRVLVIYVRNQMVYEIPPAQIEHKGTDLVWSEANKPEKPLGSSDWSTRDIGSAWRVRVKLTEEGRLVDIQIPQMPDLRGLY